MTTKISKIVSAEELDSFQDENVYDLEMENDSEHTFFANDILVHNSQYLTFTKILDKLNVKLTDSDGNLTPEFEKIENYIVDTINEKVNEWAKTKLNSFDPRFEFKRESVCPKAIWVGKKHYILYIINKEGVKINDPADAIKYSGLSVVKASYSDEVKSITKGIVEGIMKGGNKAECDQSFNNEYEKFNELSVKEVSTRSSMKVLTKWGSSANGLDTISRCPRHAKWSVYHNHLVKIHGLEKKYSLIEDGKKVKLVYVKPNLHNIDGIAYMDEFPVEFGLDPDYDRMFQICVVKCLTPIYNAMGWAIPDPRLQYENTVEDLFGYAKE